MERPKKKNRKGVATTPLVRRGLRRECRLCRACEFDKQTKNNQKSKTKQTTLMFSYILTDCLSSVIKVKGLDLKRKFVEYLSIRKLYCVL